MAYLFEDRIKHYVHTEEEVKFRDIFAKVLPPILSTKGLPEQMIHDYLYALKTSLQ